MYHLKIPQSMIEPFGVLGWPKPIFEDEVLEDFQVFEVSVLRTGDRVILHFENNPEENGVYEVTST